jgi:hypothetical protein
MFARRCLVPLACLALLVANAALAKKKKDERLSKQETAQLWARVQEQLAVDPTSFEP